MSHINYTATIDTMGEADDSYAESYISALRCALADRFPGAAVSVERNDRLSSSVIDCSGDIDRNEINAIANQVWNDAEFA